MIAIAPALWIVRGATIAPGNRRTRRPGRLIQSALAIALAIFTMGPGASVQTTVAGAQESAEKIFDLKLERGRVAQNLRRLRVTQGNDLRLRWTADAPIVLHLHGYDIEKKVVPGTVTEFRFKANAAGRFAVSIHRQGSAHHHDPVLVLEVYPR
jgi:hypothetical protein